MSEWQMNTDSGAPEPVRRKLLSQRAYDLLRRDISGRRLPPGTVLNEATLSEQYEISRTPFREALFRLRQEGFLEKAGRQLRVKEFTLTDVEDLYLLREALEKMAVRLCIERTSDASLEAVARQLDRYCEFDPTTDYEAYNEHVNEFHRSIARLCGSRMIQDQLLAIHDKVLVISDRYWKSEHSLEDARREHGFILRAIFDRDVMVAEAAVRAHVQGVIALYRQNNTFPVQGTGR